jgi:putative intracellular protease/amidase
MSRILFVTTSHRNVGSTGKPTGLWLEELAVPYYVLRDAGHQIDIASIRGGEVPLDPGSVKPAGQNGAESDRFLQDAAAMQALRTTPAVEDVRFEDYEAVFLPGGHGTMWDLPESQALARGVGRLFDAGKIVAAVCHGPAGLVSAKRADGQPIVKDKRVNSFTDAEEKAAGLEQAVPFLLASRLTELGARFEGGENFTPYSVQDGNLITGQNPMSSGLVAQAVLKALG